MNAKTTATSASVSARQLFLKDIADTEEYLGKMQSHIKELCESEGLVYPRKGRGRRGMFPNIPYAVHFRLQGLEPQEAAEKYIQAEFGRSVLPAESVPAGCC